MNHKQLALKFDHTHLKADAQQATIEQLCQEAANNGFMMVAINSCQVALCKELLSGTPVHIGAAIGFPLGQTTIPVKVYETLDAIKNGADEIDYVINLTALKAGNWDYIKNEMQEIVNCCRQHHVISKVIFENCYLTKDEIIELCLIAKNIKPDFIKTSTGFGSGGATISDVELMVKTVNGACQVKAAGGIRDWVTCKAMLEAGATRIGTSNSLKILAEFDASQEDQR